jgi:hypothetical protein
MYVHMHTCIYGPIWNEQKPGRCVTVFGGVSFSRGSLVVQVLALPTHTVPYGIFKTGGVLGSLVGCGL